MKKFLLFSFLLSFSFLSAQFNQDAPWMKNLDIESNRSNLKFNDIVDAFNTYWETHDPDVKGSGYKPFMRWQTFWENFVKEDGTLPTSEELYNVWLQKQASTSRNPEVDNSNWQPVGPFSHTNTGSWSSGQGRVNSILVDPNNAANGTNIYYSGAPAGGIWKSTDGGSTWTVLTDDLPQIGVSGIAVEYGNADTIYIATGDDDAGDSFSVGVWKSTDGGTTWNPTGLNPSNSPSRMNDIYIHPSDPNTLWVATNNGVYKTTNAGTSWTSTLTGSNVRDIKLKPGDPTTIYAATSSQVYKSTNSGTSFTLSSSGIATSSNRLVIDVTPDNPDVLYVLSSVSNNFNALYKSSNSGSTYSIVASSLTAGDIFESPQAWYDMAMAVSDTDENIVFTGVLNIWRLDINGSNPTATKINNWSSPNSASYSHADIHLLRFYNGELFAGTDGGFYKTSDYGINFTDLTEGMQIGQFYRIAVSNQTSSNMVGGLQDNGGYAINGTTNQWQNYYGADGMDTAIDPSNPNLYYGFTQNGGSLNISSNGGASFTGQFGSATSGGNWITPLTMNSDGELYAGYSTLYRFTGSGWTAVSSSLGSNIDVLEIDDINPDNIYIAVNASLRKSTNRGLSFSSVENFASNITSIEVNNTDNTIVYVTTSGTGGGVYRSTDGGSTFTNITGSLPNVTKNVIKHQGNNIQNPLYLGTSLGVYRYDDSTGIWEEFDNNLPNVSVRDLEINLVDENVTAATYGRGVWQSDLATTTLASDDVRLVSVEGVSPTIINCGDVTPQLVVKNNGLNTINSIDVSYTIDGGTPSSFTWTGTLTSEQETSIDLPVLTLTKGEHQFFASTAIVNDQFPDNNDSSSITFNVNDLGVAQDVNTFENASQALIAFDEGGATTLWQRGVPTGSVLNSTTSGTQVYGTNLAGNHPDLTKGYLVSQCYNLSEITDPVLKFNMAFVIEQDWDLVYMEYSTDNGLNWSLLGAASDPNWYNSSRFDGDGVADNCFNCVGGQWTGTDTALKEYSYDLAGLASEASIMFRFVFHSDQSVNEEGVIIDDFVIEGIPLSTNEFAEGQFSVYPNPSSDIFNIKMTNSFEDVTFSVYDVTGKVVLNSDSKPVNQTNYTLDMNGYASGIYFLKITTNLGEATKKLILN